MNTLIRKVDVVARRRVRHALVAWHTLACKASLLITRIACALPSNRRTQDRTLYMVAAIGAAVALHVAIYRG